jgi:dTDP-4-dehydrorhamnose reductase
MFHVYVFGANGVLGRNIVQALKLNEHFNVYEVSRPVIPNYEKSTLLEYFKHINSATILNCIGILPDRAELFPELSRLANFEIVDNIAHLLKMKPEFNLIHMSTSLVFDGLKSEPYMESDNTSPKSVYGHHKVQAENLILERIASQSAIYRFGSLVTNNPTDKTTFNSFLRRLRLNEPILVESGRRISLCNVEMIVNSILSNFTSHKVLHVSHSTPTSWPEIIKVICEKIEIDSNILGKVFTNKIDCDPRFTLRPRNSSLASNVQVEWKSTAWKDIVLGALKS